jgi:hypothetical protein
VIEGAPTRCRSWNRYLEDIVKQIKVYVAFIFETREIDKEKVRNKKMYKF